MLKYGYTILYVPDIGQTLKFYENAFGFTKKFITPEKDYAELETGITVLAFALPSIATYNGISISKSNSSQLPPPFELTFVSDNIDLDFQTAVDAGALVISPPQTKPWGQTIAYLKDINGFLIELCTPVSAS